jgi:hypothetical protein
LRLHDEQLDRSEDNAGQTLLWPTSVNMLTVVMLGHRVKVLVR